MPLFEIFAAWAFWRSADAQRRIADEMARYNDMLAELRKPLGRIEPRIVTDDFHDIWPDTTSAASTEPPAYFIEPTDWRLPAPDRLDLVPQTIIASIAPPRRSWWRRLARFLAR